MIFPLRTVIPRNGHVVGSHVPGDAPLLLDVRDFECQVGDAMSKRRSKYSRIASRPWTAS